MISEVITADASVDIAAEHVIGHAHAAKHLTAEFTVPGELGERGVKDLVYLLKLLADETRLRIVLYLAQSGELHVRALCDRIKQSQPAVSHHLALLRVAGIVECRRNGKHNYYHVLPERFEKLLDLMFESVPPSQRQIYFHDYVLQQDRRV